MPTQRPSMWLKTKNSPSRTVDLSLVANRPQISIEKGNSGDGQAFDCDIINLTLASGWKLRLFNVVILYLIFFDIIPFYSVDALLA